MAWYVNSNWGAEGGTVTLSGGTRGWPHNVGGYLAFGSEDQAQKVADTLNAVNPSAPTWYPTPNETDMPRLSTYAVRPPSSPGRNLPDAVKELEATWKGVSSAAVALEDAAKLIEADPKTAQEVADLKKAGGDLHNAYVHLRKAIQDLL